MAIAEPMFLALTAGGRARPRIRHRPGGRAHRRTGGSSSRSAACTGCSTGSRRRGSSPSTAKRSIKGGCGATTGSPTRAPPRWSRKRPHGRQRGRRPSPSPHPPGGRPGVVPDGHSLAERRSLAEHVVPGSPPTHRGDAMSSAPRHLPTTDATSGTPPSSRQRTPPAARLGTSRQRTLQRHASVSPRRGPGEGPASARPPGPPGSGSPHDPSPGAARRLRPERKGHGPGSLVLLEGADPLGTVACQDRPRARTQGAW